MAFKKKQFKKGLGQASRSPKEPLTGPPVETDEPLSEFEQPEEKKPMMRPKPAMMSAAPEAEIEEDDQEEPEDEATGIPVDPNSEETKATADEDDLNEEIDANFQMACDAAKDWIEEAKEDIEFKAGTQWTEEDKATLEAQGRPCLTFNKIKPIINLVTGHFVQNSNRIQVSPEGGEDQRFSEVADKLIQFVDEQAQLEFNFGYQFSGGETTGEAWMELYLDYEKDPIFGELRSIYHGKPGTIFLDPRCNTYDINQSAQFLFKLVKKSKADLKDLYPEKEKEIDDIGADTENPSYGSPTREGDGNNYGIAVGKSKVGINTSSVDPDRDSLKQFHVKEYWYVKRVDKYYAYFIDSGDLVKHDSEEECNAEVEQRRLNYLQMGGDPAAWKPIIRERKVREVWVAVRAGGVILANAKSPFEPYYNGIPFFRFIAQWTPEAEEDVDAKQGVVRCMKDPQREKNKARSQFLHIINTAANSGWIGDEDAVPVNKREELRQFGSMPGITIWKKPGSALQRIEPVPPPIAQQVREKATSDDFKEVSGLNADLLSLEDSGSPSGKALAIRIRQAVTILEPDFRNFRYTKRLVGECVMKILPTLFDVAKMRKVLGDSFMKANAIDDVYLKVFNTLIEDSKYNVNVAERGDTRTSREETFEDLTTLMEKGMQIPFEIIAEYLNIPNKTEVIQKVMAAQQQAQQAAMMQQNGAMPPQ